MDPASKQAAKYKTQSFIGIINDKMEVGMAKIRGEEMAALDVAIIKATIQDDVVPKEKHVRTLKIACSAQSSRQVVNYVIHGLCKRLDENPKAWLVTLKTLIVFHRLMRETDPGFQLELLNYAERTGRHRMLRLESFADHTTKETWDFSAWIRVYSLYLDERQGVFRIMRFDPEHEQGAESRESKLSSCSAAELLEYLPAVQRLLRQLVCCIPEGSAQRNEISLLACSLVLKEVRSVYKVVCEGILNLVDRIFEMDRGDALKGVELVKENLTQNDRLNAFVSAVANIPPLKGAVQFPTLQPLPADFLTTLEEYVKDAPKSAGDAGKSTVGRSGSIAPKAGPRLVVGGPIKDAPSGPTSPPQQPPAPFARAPEVDLLGGFEALSVREPEPISAAVPAAARATAFDPFTAFVGAPPPAPAQPVPAPTPQPQPSQLPAPTLIHSLAGPGSFSNTAAAVAAIGIAGLQRGSQPLAMTASPASGFNGATFGTANAFGALPPALFPQAAPARPGPQPANAAMATKPPAPSNPFANSTMHAAIAAQMRTPAPLVSTPQPFVPPPPLVARQHVNAYGQPYDAAAPQVPAGFQAPAALPYASGPGTVESAGLGPVGLQQPAYTNPFCSPSAPGPQPTTGVYSPSSVLSPTNPFGGAGAPAVPASNISSGNPFGTAPAGAGWSGMPTVAQVGGYTMKKAPDPLNDLSLDLFGKTQAAPIQQPMRPQLGTPPNGSPGAFF